MGAGDDEAAGCGRGAADAAPLIQRIVDRREDVGEAEAEHLEGDEAGERDQRGDQAIFDRGGTALVGAQIGSGHGVPAGVWRVGPGGGLKWLNGNRILADAVNAAAGTVRGNFLLSYITK